MIESAPWIGRVPRDVYTVSEPIKEDIPQTHSEEEEVTESKGHSPPKIDADDIEEEKPAQDVQKEEHAPSITQKQQTPTPSSPWTGNDKLYVRLSGALDILLFQLSLVLNSHVFM